MSARPANGTIKKTTRVEPDAVRMLTDLPGKHSKDEIKRWLYTARVLSQKEDAYQNICTYIRNSQNHGFGIKVLAITRIVRNGDIEFEHDDKKRNRFRMMLWHGTKDDNVAKILESGMHRPNPHNQMFGTGIYFADRASKSARYCPHTPSASTPPNGSVGYLFLCDVLVGNSFNAQNPRNADSSPPSYLNKRSGKSVHFDSVKCTGKFIPNRKRQIRVKGSIWPLGPTIENKKFDKYTVEHNEYIIYDPGNVRLKYLVKVKFTEKP